jgi:hypothetical protein
VLAEPGVAKVHWPLWAIDETGRRTGATLPGHPLSQGDLRAATIESGPGSNAWPPTSGNACVRPFLESVCPIPEDDYRLCADAYLFTLAPVWGRVRRIDEPLAHYRVHGGNNYWTRPFDEKLLTSLQIYEKQCAALQSFLEGRGARFNTQAWLASSWWHRAARLVRAIVELIPPGRPFILVDDQQIGSGQVVAGRPCLPFLEKDGQYWGPPADDTTALRELQRLRGAGCDWFLVSWPSFWWLEHYQRLRRELESVHRCVARTDQLIAFQLQQ